MTELPYLVAEQNHFIKINIAKLRNSLSNAVLKVCYLTCQQFCTPCQKVHLLVWSIEVGRNRMVTPFICPKISFRPQYDKDYNLFINRCITCEFTPNKHAMVDIIPKFCSHISHLITHSTIPDFVHLQETLLLRTNPFGFICTETVQVVQCP